MSDELAVAPARAPAGLHTIPLVPVLTLVGIALAELPLVLAACCGPADRTGLGSFWFINDFAQYEAALREAASTSSWLVHNHFTPEPHPPALMFSPYVALGKLVALTGLSSELFLRTTELVARLALLGSLTWFVRTFLADRACQALAFVLAAFGMGLGLPVAIVASLAGWTPAYTGNGSYESNTVGLLFGAPHATLGMALSLAMAAAFWQHRRSPAAWKLGLVVAAGPLVALLQPFHLPGLLLALFVGAVAGLRHQSSARPAFGALLATFASSALAGPLLGLTAITFLLDPFWAATYGSQNQLPSPRPWQLPIDYGIVLLLALPGTAIALRRGGALRWLAGFVGLLALLMYLPVPFQRRLSFGLQPALAALAALGALEIERLLQRRGTPGRKLFRPAMVGLALCTTAVAVFGFVASALADVPLRAYRASLEEAAAANWLNANSSAESVIMASWESGNFLAGRVSGRVVGGHPVATVKAAERSEEIVRFFSRGGEEARWLAQKYGVTHVWYGERERALGGPALTEAAWLRLAHGVGQLEVLAVVER